MKAPYISTTISHVTGWQELVILVQMYASCQCFKTQKLSYTTIFYDDIK